MRFRGSAQARRELVVVVAERYRSSARAEKLRILEECVAVTGYQRKHAILLLSAGASDGHGRTGTVGFQPQGTGKRGFRQAHGATRFLGSWDHPTE